MDSLCASHPVASRQRTQAATIQPFCPAGPNQQVVVGIVYNPILDETFAAVRGRGAFLNDKSIRVTAEADLGSALIATEVECKSS